jgi:hypothetical protein
MCCVFSHGVYRQTYDRIYEQVVAILDVKDLPKPQSSNLIGWGMANCMYELMLKKTKDLVQATRFISLSCDEITTMD